MTYMGGVTITQTVIPLLGVAITSGFRVRLLTERKMAVGDVLAIVVVDCSCTDVLVLDHS